MNRQKLAYKKLGNVSLFDNEETLDKLNSLGNPLEKLSTVIDFEMFRNDLEEGLYKEKFTSAGAKPYDYVLMFKILVLQRMYHLSDEQTEYQIRDACLSVTSSVWPAATGCPMPGPYGCSEKS